MVCLPWSANAGAEMASVSSGSVKVSVSVAPRYKLLAAKPLDMARVGQDGHSERLCLATNSLRPIMPLTLVRRFTRGPNESEPHAAQEIQIRAAPHVTGWTCMPLRDDSALLAFNPADRPGSQLLLVRPE